MESSSRCGTLVVVLAVLSAVVTAQPSQNPGAETSSKAVQDPATAPLSDDSQGAAQQQQQQLQDIESQQEQFEPVQYPFRDLPADVLRDFPGLCFGSTALRLFQVGQSWSLTPFCGVATCLVSEDRYHLIERVQDCGLQPKRNPRCRNVNLASEAQFPECCPVFECDDGVELEYPTQEELQQLAHEAAQAAVRAQYEEALAESGLEETARTPEGVEQQQGPQEDIAAAVAAAAADPSLVVTEAAQTTTTSTTTTTTTTAAPSSDPTDPSA